MLKKLVVCLIGIVGIVSSFVIPAFAGASITMAWDAVTGGDVPIEHYLLERRTGATGEFVLVATLPPTSLEWTDTELEYSTLYQWQVRARGNQGELSLPSNILEATTTPIPPALDPPKNFSGRHLP